MIFANLWHILGVDVPRRSWMYKYYCMLKKVKTGFGRYFYKQLRYLDFKKMFFPPKFVEKI